jgi:hypothetical protein
VIADDNYEVVDSESWDHVGVNKDNTRVRDKDNGEMTGVPRQNAIYQFEHIPVGKYQDYPIEKRSSIQVCLDQYKKKYGEWFQTKTIMQYGVAFVRVYKHRD